VLALSSAGRSTGPRLELQQARLDFRQIEDVVDQREQVRASIVDVADKAAQLGIELSQHAVLEHFGKPDDRGERRPQLVRHVGEEVGLGAVGLFKRLVQPLQLGLGLRPRGQLPPRHHIGGRQQRGQQDQRDELKRGPQIPHLVLLGLAQPQQAAFLLVHLAQDAEQALAHLGHRDARDVSVRRRAAFGLVQLFDAPGNRQALVYQRTQLRPARLLAGMIRRQLLQAAQGSLALRDRGIARGELLGVAGEPVALRAQLDEQRVCLHFGELTQNFMGVRHPLFRLLYLPRRLPGAHGERHEGDQREAERALQHGLEL
jgi:hypothetical protein